MPRKHENRGIKPKSILKNRKLDLSHKEAAGEPEAPPLPSREKSGDAAPTIRSNSKRALHLLTRIKQDQSPVASFFGVARLKGSALDLHNLLKDEAGHVRTGEGDIRRLFKGEPKKLRDLLEQDAELPGKTIQTKTEFVSINSQFNKIVVGPLEKTFRNRGRSKPDYSHLRKQAELLLGQAREARSSLKQAVQEAKQRNSANLEPDPIQFKIPGQRRKKRKRHSHSQRKK
ncbi:hypothetical protein MPH_03388 [Macrophomina phaseolina MS6]|uniref:Uncharacterized protein n=1 Tax=Macrophomina phaseolina (strain MS6) TaxID=1126212 RepID=K2SAV0_MACPH|nr:hypothetical protein MPH_03388 [Macrophomina phaseolina MS6]